MKIRILIADGFSVVRQGLLSFLSEDKEIEVVGMAASGREAIDLTRQLKPDLILLDLALPDMDGCAVTKIIHQEFPQTMLVVFTNSLQSEVVAKAIKVGANGFLLKNVEKQELCTFIKSASAGKILLSAQVADILARASVPPPNVDRPFEKLTNRESDVLRLLAQGKSNKEIAFCLHLSEKTIKLHVSIILAKLGLQSRTQAALQAARSGLL